jgi:hypothetical protein
MSDNPYQTPQGEPLNHPDPSEATGLYVVSKKKFVILNIATLGFYLMYWFYRNWRLHKQAGPDKNIWPVARAFFAVFFVHALFRIVDQKRQELVGNLPTWDAGRHATIIVLLLLTGTVCDRLSARSIGSPLTDFVSILLLLPITACVVSAQGKINEACGDPTGDSNSSFTTANIVWILLGVVVWILAVIGLFFLAPEYMAG